MTTLDNHIIMECVNTLVNLNMSIGFSLAAFLIGTLILYALLDYILVLFPKGFNTGPANEGRGSYDTTGLPKPKPKLGDPKPSDTK